MIPDAELGRVRLWLDEETEAMPAKVREQVRLEIDQTEKALTVLECHPVSPQDVGGDWYRVTVCRFRYGKTRDHWSLEWCDQNDKFHRYENASAEPDLDVLIQMVKDDPTGIFWG